ncbi:UMP kinase [Candidatus Calescamantes bacterium]|nr:UMP kinase [Candidatus Calescamantes bacterium]
MQKYSRILLKLSGDFFSGGRSPIDCTSLQFITGEIKECYKLGVEIGVVVGGGNIVRGASLCPGSIDRYTADYMGMMSTVINGMALKSFLEATDISSSLYSALDIKGVVPPFELDKVRKDLENKKVVILTGGTGNPYFTTDTAAALRAVEIKADIFLKGTKVDGVYDKDPLLYSDAQKFDFLTYQEALQKEVRVIDMSAIILCQEHSLPIKVFKMDEKGNLGKVLKGESLGTLLREGKK